VETNAGIPSGNQEDPAFLRADISIGELWRRGVELSPLIPEAEEHDKDELSNETKLSKKILRNEIKSGASCGDQDGGVGLHKKHDISAAATGQAPFYGDTL